ncbi:hypothetical protein EHM69_11905 [candidate division KSB1 bacterium]|nr:MAG: hypothetical protein EHM69_11905 [candidate division KSB1 bacterium]
MDTPLYEEKQSFFLRPLFVLIIFAILLWGAWDVHETPLHSVMLIGMAFLSALIFWGFSELRSKVTATEFIFGFPFYKKRIPLDQLTVGGVQRISFGAGVGIHFWRGSWLYCARFGRGVEISVDDTKYLIGSDHPEMLQAALLQRASPRATR